MTSAVQTLVGFGAGSAFPFLMANAWQLWNVMPGSHTSQPGSCWEACSMELPCMYHLMATPTAAWPCKDSLGPDMMLRSTLSLRVWHMLRKLMPHMDSRPLFFLRYLDALQAIVTCPTSSSCCLATRACAEPRQLAPRSPLQPTTTPTPPTMATTMGRTTTPSTATTAATTTATRGPQTTLATSRCPRVETWG